MARWLAALAAWILLAAHALASADGAIVYGIVPQLAGRHGLASVTHRLGAIAALGANVVWLSPITGAPPGDFGYAVTDLRHVRASLGGAADLRALVARAHALGLRVILDLPTNDVSDRHPFFQDLQRRGDASPYHDYFARDAAGRPAHYFDWTHLINLNFNDAGVRSYVTSASAHWLRDFGLDGFRLDAAWGPRRRSPGFWPAWAKAMRRIEPNALLIAEASARDRYFAAAGFDAAYDWTDRPGDWAWQAAFSAPDPARRLRAAIAEDLGRGPVFRFLDNNDTGARFITRHGIAMTRVAAALLMTLPGIPCVYMGDEDGAAFDPYRTQRPIDWHGDPRLRAWWMRLIALRRREPALIGDRLRFLATPDDATVLAYLRPGASAEESVLIALNFGPAAAKVRLPAESRLFDLIGDAGAPLSWSAPVLSLPPMSVRILGRRPPL